MYRHGCRVPVYTGPMQSKAATVKEYIASLPEDRRKELEAVRKVILKNLDPGFEEGMQYGMLGYFVPHRLFPAGYHCDPRQALPFAGLASQKGHLSLYLMCIYGASDLKDWFVSAWAKSGKRLDMGKACIRFKKADDLALDVIGQAIKRVTLKKYVDRYVANLEQMAKAKAKTTVKTKTVTNAKSTSKSKKQ